MNYKRTFKRRLKAARKPVMDQMMPTALMRYGLPLLLRYPGYYAGSPREFAWKEMRRAADLRRRREAGA